MIFYQKYVDRHKRYSNNSLINTIKGAYMDKTTRLIRLKEVMNRTGYSRSWIYELIKVHEFPTQIQLGPRAIAFIESEIDEWINDKIYYSRNKAA
jgi:prophage regulatory protein